MQYQSVGPSVCTGRSSQFLLALAQAGDQTPLLKNHVQEYERHKNMSYTVPFKTFTSQKDYNNNKKNLLKKVFMQDVKMYIFIY